MVKGISRQVVVVRPPDPKLFEQAIFILKEDAQGVTDEALLREADQAVRTGKGSRARRIPGFLWALGGAAATGLAWLLFALL